MKHHIGRRSVLAGLTGGAAFLASPAIVHSAGSAPMKMGTFFSLTGPASLFGPTQTACTALAVDQINAAGGILGKQVEIVPGDGGLSPAEAAQAAIRMTLQDRVDFIVGSHNSAVRQSIIAAIKGRVPYIYTPLYEGGECAPNTYVTADTPQQQVRPALNALHEMYGIRKVYLIGNDYVWPQKLNEQAKKYISAFGGEIVGEEYAPLGPGNRFDDAVTRIRAAQPDLVFISLVGGDNVNFNRAFAGFGLDASVRRLSALLEELSLAGIGAENSKGLFSSMSYFTAVDSPENDTFKSEYAVRFGADAPPLSMLGADAYSGTHCAAALLTAAGVNEAAAVMAASQGLSYRTATGIATMSNRHVSKDIYLAECKGVEFEIVKAFDAVEHGETCSV